MDISTDLNVRNSFEVDEILSRYLEEMERPRPISTARMILARGAVRWGLNILAGIPVAALLALSAASVGGESIIAAILILSALGYVAYQLFQRISEPFLWARLLRTGEVKVLPVVKREGTSGVFSKFGAKARTTYTLRFGNGSEDPALKVVYDGSVRYGGETCVVLYEPGAGQGNDSEAEPVAGSVPPKRFFALDCFLFHRLLTFPDLLEGAEQEMARAALGYDENWNSRLGSTGAGLLYGSITALAVVLAILGLLLVLLRTGI